MDNKKVPFFTAAAWLAVAVTAVLLVAAVFDVTARAVIGYAAASKDAAFTAAHFVSPAMPGRIGFSLALLLPVLAALAWFVEEPPLAHEASPECISAGGGMPRAGGMLAGVVILLLLSAAVKTAAIEPMIVGDGRVAGLVRFLGGINRAFAAKARFDEKEYVRCMAGALLADGPAFGRFARSWYWAYFADEGVTRESRRVAAAIAALEPLYREGRLTDPAAFELAKLFSENGMLQNARGVIESLLTRNPLNVDYAEFKAALAAENEK